jgi:hypothetical protein
MTKKQNVQNNPESNSPFWIFFGFGFIWPLFVWDFDIRISDLCCVELAPTTNRSPTMTIDDR